MNLEFPVVRTKIIIPRRRTEILSRPRLLSILENVLDLKLLILAAPAGYGKTSLLIDFAYHTQLPVCWFALDNLDCDPQRFIAHFISAIANRFPTFGEASFSALNNLNQDTLNLDPVISAIINDAYDHISEHFVFVLDDYHLVRDSKPIDTFVNRITLEMSENCHLIIASRTLLTLPDLTLLVSRSQVEGLSFEELAFLPEEIKQLISVNYHQSINEDTATELVRQTEGWITGLLLTAQISPKETNDRLRLARVSGIGIYEYLAQQVLDRQSEEMKLFLLRTSLLEEFDALLCEQILTPALKLENENWHERIEVLLRDNLFVLPVGDETLYLRYHHLFHDFLQSRMRVERPEETARIEKILAAFYEQIKEWERALAIYSRVGDFDQIAEVIRKAAPSMILGGRLVSLTSWLEYLPEQERDGRPELLSIKGTIAMLRGETQRSLEILDRAIEGLRNCNSICDLVTALVRRSSVNRYLGYYETAKRDADEAAQICGNTLGMEKLNAEALRARGIVLYQSGDLKNSLFSLKESWEIYHSLGEDMDAAKVQLDLGVVHLALGQLDEADKAYQGSLNYWQLSQNSLWQANLWNNIGVLQHLRGKFEQAALSFERAVSYARLASNPRLEGFSLTSLGDLFRDIRALPEARQAYRLAREVSGSVDDLALNVFLSLSESVLERISGNYGESLNRIELALKQARKGGSKYEVNLCQFELCALNFVQEKIKDQKPLLRNLEKFFSHEGFHLESLKSSYFLALISLVDDKTQKKQKNLLKVIIASQIDLERSPLNQIGLETLKFLEDHHLLKSGEPKISEFISNLHEFEASLVQLRRVIRRHSDIIQFSAPKLVISAFGKGQVKIGDHQILPSEWKTQVARDLFFYILQHPEGVTKEEIGEAFWPESTEDTLRLRFKNSIYRVRRALGGDSVTFIEDYYRFNRSLEYEYDVENFLQEIKLAQSATQVDEQIMHNRLAVNYYKGAYLPKLDYEWVLNTREQYHQNFITAVTKLVNLYIQTEQYQLAIHYSERAIEEDSCNEAAYRSAMLAFSALGNRAGVSRLYVKCKNMLKKELEIEPSLQTQNLYKTLMQ
ncbi:MAG: hypothetical protein FD147_626 [Chloroflexi bacterium]|nr:MAG: hypothetical protein FD147_626 [Chloroflexota bacterium]